MEQETKKKLLAIALDILEHAGKSCYNTHDQWLLVEHAERICHIVVVPISEALGTERYPSFNRAMSVVSNAIDKLSQEGSNL